MMKFLKIWSFFSIPATSFMFLFLPSLSMMWGGIKSFTDSIMFQDITPVLRHNGCKKAIIGGEDRFTISAYVRSESPYGYDTAYFAYTSPKEPKVLHAICSVEFRKALCQAPPDDILGCYCKNRFYSHFEIVLNEVAYEKYNNSRLALMLMDQESIRLLYSKLVLMPFHVYKRDSFDCLPTGNDSYLSRNSAPIVRSSDKLANVLLANILFYFYQLHRCQ